MNLKLLLAVTALATCAATAAPAGDSTAKPSPVKSSGYWPRPANTLTFTKDIAPIVWKNCAECHRAGEVGPFPLTSYQDVARRAKTICAAIDKGAMPPWKAAPVQRYHDERVLSAEQVGLIKQWAAEGAREGNPADLPPMPKFNSGWKLGTPDLVLEMPEEFSVAAEGRDVYRNFVIPTGLTEDRWLAAVEVHPGNRGVVHHVIVHFDTSGQARELDARDPGPGYGRGAGGIGLRGGGQIGGWAPGNDARLAPTGVGRLLPKNADIVLQVHYNKSGKPEKDRTKVGLHFVKGPVDQRWHTFPLVARLSIPAGDPDYVTRSTIPVPTDSTLHSIMPHMHLVGREMKVTATLPNGKEVPLVHVPQWDFNWQMTYAFAEPVKLPRGSRINMEAHYDNSSKNPSNPNNPPRAIRWGEQTNDEMCLAYLNFTYDGERLTKGQKVDGLSDILRDLGEQFRNTRKQK